MAIERLDDLFMPGDWTQLRVDGDHSGGQYALFEGVGEEESKRLDGAQAQLYGLSLASRYDRILHGWRMDSWETFPPWADVGGFQYGELPNQSVVEFAITPWDDLNWEGPELSRRSVLEAGKIIGFHIELHDWDSERGSFVGIYRLALPEMRGSELGPFGPHDHFADNFVDGELIPCHRGDCGSAPPGVSAVRMDSWARIKASFR